MQQRDKGLFNPSFAASQDYASSFEAGFAGLNDFGLSASHIKPYVLNRHLKTLAGINSQFSIYLRSGG